jgi:hypothetical protein
MTPLRETAALNRPVSTRIVEIGAITIGLIMLAGIALAGAFAFGFLPVERANEGPRVEAVDGWLPAMTAANRALTTSGTNAAVDGWASALLKAEQPIVDGWAPALLEPEQQPVDGWAARYFADGD